MITARHAEIAKNELGEESQVESDKENHSGKARESFRIQPACNLRPPKVQAADVTHHRASDHDVVEVGDDEISVVNVNVQTQAGEEQTGEASNGEQADEAQGVEHGGVPGN